MKEKYEKLYLKNQLCFPIYLCSKEIIRKYTPYLSKIDLTYTQYIVMMHFWEVKTSNVKDLGKALMLDSSTLTPLLKKLESKGFITRNKSMVDERNLLLELTSKGEKLKEKAISIPDQMGSCIDLEEEEIKILSKIIYKILINIEKENEK